MTDPFTRHGLFVGTPFIAAETEDGTHAVSSPAVRAILEERRDPVERHGYTTLHDDGHDEAEIGRGALAYLIAGLREELSDDPAAGVELGSVAWPWGGELFRPTDYAGCLVKAGAMIVAELDRVIRTRALLEYLEARR